MAAYTFPDRLLDMACGIAPGADLTADPSTWTWTDITVMPSGLQRLLNTPVAIKRGIAIGATNQQTTSATVELRNDDGALTPGLVTSPYWPYVDAGTPIRLQVRTQADLNDTFTRTAVSNGWGVAGTGETWGLPDLSSAFSTNGTQGLIAHTAVNTAHWIRAQGRTFRNVEVLCDFTFPAVATGGIFLIGPELRSQDAALTRLWCTIEPGLAGVVNLKVRQYINSTSQTTLATVTVAGLTYSGGNAVRLRVRVVDDAVQMRAWLASGLEPSVWHVDITQTGVTGFEGVPDGIGIRDSLASTNTNTLPVVYAVDNLTVTEPYTSRVEGYIADVRPTFQPLTGGITWSTVLVDIGGIGSRLEKNQSPAYSPMRRSVQLATTTPLTYWPIEDDEGSTFAASAFPGGPNMQLTGPAVFAFSAGTPDTTTYQTLSGFGTKPLVSLAAGARLSGVVPTSGVTSQWAISLVVDSYAPGVPGVTEVRTMQWDTPSGTHNRWALVGPITGGYQVRAYNDAAGTVTNVVTYSAATFIDQGTFTIECHQTGADIFVELFVNDGSLASGTLTGSTQGPITRVTINPDRVNTTASTDPYGIRFIVGHCRVLDDISVHDTPFYFVPENGQGVTSIFGWYKEPAHRRLARLCAEERVPFTFAGDPGTTGMTILNAQQQGSFTDLVTAATEAESGGLLYEDGFGYRYLPRSARYNQDADLIVDMAQYRRSEDTDQADILVPQLDSRAANYWTIQRTDGASQSYAADAAYRKRRGTINEQRVLDVLTDDVVLDHAAWRVHLGVDGRGALYPSMPLDLAANPSFVQQWLSCDIGSRVQRINQPSIAGSGTIDQVIEGVVETVSPTSWDVVLACSPATVWDVGVWDDGVSRYSPSTTTLSAPLNTTALSFTMTGEPWVTGAVSFNLTIDGEDILISNISGSGNGPYTVTVPVGGRSRNGLVASHLSGAAVALTSPVRWAL